jgi:hypothetical protein
VSDNAIAVSLVTNRATLTWQKNAYLTVLWRWGAPKAAGPTGSRRTWPAPAQGHFVPHTSRSDAGKLRRGISSTRYLPSRCSFDDTSLPDRSASQHGVNTDISCKHTVCFIAARSSAALSHSKPTVAGTCSDSCGAQYNNKRYSLY